MRESYRDEQLIPVLGAEFGAHPMAKGGRARAHIDSDIVNPPADAPHELVLCAWRRLKMQAAQGEYRFGKRVVVLHEYDIDTPIGE
ncbi:hypothetical protein GCM10022600_02980 [Qipengyuania pelagi]